MVSCDTITRQKLRFPVAKQDRIATQAGRVTVKLMFFSPDAIADANAGRIAGNVQDEESIAVGY